MKKLITLAFAASLVSGASVYADTLQYQLGTLATGGYTLNYTSGTGSFFVSGGFTADLSTAVNSGGGPLALAVMPSGSSAYFTDGNGLGGSYFSGFNLELYTVNPTPPGLVYTNSKDPLFATVQPVWTFTQQFAGNSGLDYYTLALTGTTVNLYQSVTSSSIGTLIATGPETGAYPTNLPGYPAPEPTTLGLFLTAGAGILGLRKYQMHKG